ncbi:integral membrane protein [Ophiocordyceps sinensis CO18]|uniref:Integral membrane protein n=1 Tax=Ophiocordyceps sinensis (strain Co18 / CGMCC 3.14243) TaxID=911162 RepID=T5A466_OPHSC|nr:integral membrane protein [Ophiocordyceps sinensis CO18]
MGDGLAPFRAVDTYHMIFVLRYSRMIKNAGKPPRARLRRSHAQPEVRPVTENGVAEPGPLQTIDESSRRSDQTSDVNGHGVLEARTMAATGGDQDDTADIHVEDGKSGEDLGGYYPLNAKQVKSLLHHQQKLAKSHSFYKPQETHTHFSFPLNFLVAIVILLDCHSCLQISLGACTWGIDYHVRPFALTTVILCVSITCNLSAGLVITVGDRKTRKKDVMKLLDRQGLTEDAIARMEQDKEEEDERRREAILERMAAA